ncbi:hypothetical protein [Sporosarcina sp. OR05]|uniref:hypothetical protein n=1 Tax=Sporosarcina sp. OR05 TaxID=2969819 RepID=UPI00352AE58C
MDKKKIYKVIALFSFFICILAWIPNIVFQIPSPFWMSTFVVAPVGIVFATLIRKSWLIVANTLMFFSFFILMFVGYVVNANFS